jgi:hypothetical protein
VGPYLKKYLTQKRAGRVAQAVEYLPSKCEVLNTNPTTANNNNNYNLHVNGSIAIFLWKT